jgi:hypothetical protein
LRKCVRKGLKINESDINLLSVNNNPMYESVNSSENSE